jgi:hypothetical protein
MTIHVSQLFAVNTAAKILSTGLQVAQALGLPVSTWRAGDPTRSLYHYSAEVLAAHDTIVASFIKAGFLSSAIEAAKEDGNLDWLTVLAYEQYGVTVPSATYATFQVTLHNAGGGNYPRTEGEITVRSSASGATFHNLNAPAPLLAGTTVTYTFIADAPGSDSSVAVDEIDEIVTTMLGVEVVSNTAGYGQDAPTPDEIGVLCEVTLGSVSVNGPPDAYAAVCLNPELTGTAEIRRAYSTGSSTQGIARTWIASATGGVSAEGVTACRNAVAKWATPLCITPVVDSATPLPVPLVAQVQGVGLPSDFAAKVAGEYTRYLATLPIEGTVARSAVIAAIHRAVPQVTSTVITSPAADVVLGGGQVATPGSVTVTEF